ncbi:MAG: VF530 family DNA-binding protein, partial [Pseudomonadales bacterium]|nr:VF530 family DNA-binding protein [Pseudomonadales bacterium]
MNDDVNYKNNPLHGLSLKNMLIEIEDHYGFEILFAYLNINCFKTKPSIDSSVKFLKKTDWAREKVEVFYLYEFKNLPRASSEQFKLPPRDRIVPEGQAAGEPAELDLEDAERLRAKRAKKAAGYNAGSAAGKKHSMGGGYSKKRDNDKPWNRDRSSSNSTSDSDNNPWKRDNSSS